MLNLSVEFRIVIARLVHSLFFLLHPVLCIPMNHEFLPGPKKSYHALTHIWVALIEDVPGLTLVHSFSHHLNDPVCANIKKNDYL